MKCGIRVCPAKIEAVGSFLPNEKLVEARHDFEKGLIDAIRLSAVEDETVKDIVERQISCGLPFITSGELRRKHWAYDFWFGLDGVVKQHIASGRVYQQVEASTDLLQITGRIGYNPNHPFFDDFRFLNSCVAGRANCRQTLPSPANLLLEIYALSDGYPEQLYGLPIDVLISDIANAYRLSNMRFHELGCNALQYDDTALGLMCDDNYTKRLLQGGVDLIKLHGEIISVINKSLEGLPDDMEKSIYISGGDKIVPEWEYIDYPDNIMPSALSSLNVDKLFIPLELDNDYAIEVLRHIPKDKSVVLGLADAHSPFEENAALITAMVRKVQKWVSPERLYLSTRTGFKLSSYSERALLYEDQWRKLSNLASIQPSLA